jgi:hypothetical protein
VKLGISVREITFVESIELGAMFGPEPRPNIVAEGWHPAAGWTYRIHRDEPPRTSLIEGGG